MLTYYSDDHRLQDGKAELIDGRLEPCHEAPVRADIVLRHVRAAGLGEIVAPGDHGLAPIARIHAANYLGFLQTAWPKWVAEHGDYDALPLNWAVRGMRSVEPDSIDGKLSYFSFDAGTPLTAGTWQAVYASAQVALGGAAAVGGGERMAFALCRPPGHHAAGDYFGGYCFLNNAAIAAQAFRDGGAERVAVLDVDYHHGNGTQTIFDDRSDVFFASIHADPRQEYPFFLGHADETGSGAGEGATANYPLPWGTAWGGYEQALEQAVGRIGTFGAEALVISLGVDSFKDDPISRFRLEHEDFLHIGAAIAGIGLPTLIVMEGGYAVDALGVNVVNVLKGYLDAA
ncbi:histone deacetylase family protein [Oceanibacterium hippocampi]|uniref:Acetylpolyamine aminohydrolase n=1 Tax=Oceanibacterium hippocampi TaxID=745714 RepID=A0A1Y5R8Q5_9PROT|nr:histone deacetylase family protein [Oceanibacterium hippocampi]SLN10654.1 Acetylpolyamine aminohydrolase [Oceanibacterium hippocampi]